ncbi:hypothetical protein AvCA_13800 [Azotobacter vinelandii CA]|uniref:Uncharacterized protein n=2 Tax=Azotobacter vinelandii TaxID=354 RepID=C1DQS4_AZOVD|nr:hypothetical protein Avin_13800 [Azotobacter vinelandii DJ]AGK17018.1 hypothetical protein AvCA_13800 [Azotobacter vinelandii CA]AGK19876.1 hypothetical protein AvCA6_13800 [Azotobacter vinelandii CA6]
MKYQAEYSAKFFHIIFNNRTTLTPKTPSILNNFPAGFQSIRRFA